MLYFQGKIGTYVNHSTSGPLNMFHDPWEQVGPIQQLCVSSKKHGNSQSELIKFLASIKGSNPGHLSGKPAPYPNAMYKTFILKENKTC